MEEHKLKKPENLYQEEEIPKDTIENTDNNDIESEKIDKNIEIEAERLGVNIQSLQKDIERLGGSEKVKEMLEMQSSQDFYNYDGSRNVAEHTVVKEKNKADQQNLAKKLFATISIIFAGLAALGISKDPEMLDRIQHVNLSDMFPAMSEDGATAFSTVLASGGLVGGFIATIKEKLASRKAKREYVKAKMVGAKMDSNPTYK